jgi:hypothetical protein
MNNANEVFLEILKEWCWTPELEHFDQADYYRPFLCKLDIRTVYNYN